MYLVINVIFTKYNIYLYFLDSSLSDYGFQIISMDDLVSVSNEDSDLADYVQRSEQEGKQRKRRNIFSFFRKKKEKNVSDSQ